MGVDKLEIVVKFLSLENVLEIHSLFVLYVYHQFDL